LEKFDMLETLTISPKDILQELKLSCQIPAVIEGILTRKIIIRAAAAAGITVESAELQQAADSLRLLNQLRSADDTWSWLQKHHLSLDEFEEVVYTSVVSSKLASHLFSDQVKPFFVKHQLDYAGVIMYEVILDDLDLALELFYALIEGETSFPEVAAQYIQDPELRRAGGYRGAVFRTELKPEISAAVFAATPPQILKPILTASGVHLIQLEELLQPQLDEKLRLKILSDLFSAWLGQQLEQFDVELSLN
jgi:parvulin-like peptidyl-prolyl isomerase